MAVMSCLSCARKCCERAVVCRVSGMFSQCFHGLGRKRSKVFTGPFHSAFTVKCKRRDVFTYYPPLGRPREKSALLKVRL